MAAPDVFDLDEDGFNSAAGTTVEVPAEHEDAAAEGANVCPEQAIQVFA
jgi:ferredoxin